MPVLRTGRSAGAPVLDLDDKLRTGILSDFAAGRLDQTIQQALDDKRSGRGAPRKKPQCSTLSSPQHHPNIPQNILSNDNKQSQKLA